MGREYENPPLIEAVCEFQLEPGQPWDWTIPGLIYSRIAGDFPKKQEQHALQVELKMGPQEKTQTVKDQVARMQFVREDGSALVQVGPDILAVNHLHPYPKWPRFKDLILKSLGVYSDTAKPKGFRRVGLRYINRIVTPTPELTIDEYFLLVPSLPDALPRLVGNWIQLVELPFEKDNGVLKIHTGSVRDDSVEGAVFLLDLDFYTLNAEKLSPSGVSEWIELAHGNVETAFESCITDRARELFKVRGEKNEAQAGKI